MKKVVCLLSLLSILSFSCSSDEDNVSNESVTPNGPEDTEMEVINSPVTTDPVTESILPVRLVIVESGGGTETINYTYEGMKLTKEVSSEGYTSEYTYVENRLTESTFRSSDDDDTVIETYMYNEQGRLSSYVTGFPNSTATQQTTLVNYSNNDNTITLTSPDDEINDIDPDVLQLANDNILSFREGDSFLVEYTYGNNNSPFRNLENRSFLVKAYTGNIANEDFTFNNILSDTTTEIHGVEVTNYTYTFTDSGYPKVVTLNTDGNITTYTYTYNNE